MSKEDLHIRVENDFTYHKPVAGDGWALRYDQVSKLTKMVAHDLIELCPEGRDLSLALTHLEDVRMRANKAIACYLPPPPPSVGGSEAPKPSTSQY